MVDATVRVAVFKLKRLLMLFRKKEEILSQGMLHV